MKPSRLSLGLSCGALSLAVVAACAAASGPAGTGAPARGGAYSNPTPGSAIAYQIPGMHRARVTRNLRYRRVGGRSLRLDVYRPATNRGGRPLPAVLFVHGITGDPHPKDWGVYVGWGQLAAATGMVGIAFDHRGSAYPDIASDVAAAVAYVRRNAAKLGIDRSRLCVAGYSGGVPAALQPVLAGSPPYVRCLVAYYGPLDLDAGSAPDEATRRRFSATTYLRADEDAFPPLLVAKAGRDTPEINEAIDRFVAAARRTRTKVELHVHATGSHGFEVLDHDARSRRIVRSTLDFLRRNLLRG
jgi:acetyl esterase/lipase